MATRSPQASGFADGSHNVKSSFVPAERDQRDPAARRSRRHPCPVASGSVGRAQSALLSATLQAGTCQKTRAPSQRDSAKIQICDCKISEQIRPIPGEGMTSDQSPAGIHLQMMERLSKHAQVRPYHPAARTEETPS